MNINNVPILKKARPVQPIYNITPFTLLDYPDKTACIIWFAGCNMRCLYCYNPEIVLGKGKCSFDDAEAFLDSRKSLLDGVVLSGGECTMHQNIIPFVQKIKAMGFAVKIDTNGSKPLVLQQLIDLDLIDYVALDFKALPLKFQYITQSHWFLEFEDSLALLMASNIAFEIRTTAHSELIAAPELAKMVLYLEGKGFEGNYYVQHYINDVPTLAAMGHSYQNWTAKMLSTQKIQVILR